MVSLVSYVSVSALLFRIGLVGLVLHRRSVMVVLMCIELMLLAVNLQLMSFSVYMDDIMGQVFALFVLTVAAAESAIGLAILVVYFRVRGTIAMESMNRMHG
jgi:NADH-quinone oxidoreductase subunit K